MVINYYKLIITSSTMQDLFLKLKTEIDLPNGPFWGVASLTWSTCPSGKASEEGDCHCVIEDRFSEYLEHGVGSMSVKIDQKLMQISQS